MWRRIGRLTPATAAVVAATEAAAAVSRAAVARGRRRREGRRRRGGPRGRTRARRGPRRASERRARSWGRDARHPRGSLARHRDARRGRSTTRPRPGTAFRLPEARARAAWRRPWRSPSSRTCRRAPLSRRFAERAPRSLARKDPAGTPRARCCAVRGGGAFADRALFGQGRAAGNAPRRTRRLGSHNTPRGRSRPAKMSQLDSDAVGGGEGATPRLSPTDPPPPVVCVMGQTGAGKIQARGGTRARARGRGGQLRRHASVPRATHRHRADER